MPKRTINFDELGDIFDHHDIISNSDTSSVNGLDSNIIEFNDHPIFACFLVDSSGSMGPYVQGVIEGQELMLEALRGSKKCKREDALFVMQYLFNDRVVPLHPAQQLSPDGNQYDNVICLKNEPKYYKPGGMTSIFDAVFNLLKEMGKVILQGRNLGVKSQFTIGIITDGQDTSSKISPSEIQPLIRELTQKEFIKSSVVVGLTNKEFTEDMLESLRVQLCFSEKVSLNVSDFNSLDELKKKTRRAFQIVSSKAINKF